MKPKKTRYYLHGDQAENNQNLYYCRPCDLFKNTEHLATCEAQKHWTRVVRGKQKSLTNQQIYKHTLKTWKNIKKKFPLDYRPDNAINYWINPNTEAF